MTEKTSKSLAHNQVSRRESLGSYLKRFNKEVLEVDEVEEKVQLTIFKVDLKSKEFVVAFAKNPPDSMTKMLLKAQKYMNAEDALVAIGMGDTWKEIRYDQEELKGKKRERRDYSSNHNNAKSKNDKTRRTVSFIPLVIPIDKILM